MVRTHVCLSVVWFNCSAILHCGYVCGHEPDYTYESAKYLGLLAVAQRNLGDYETPCPRILDMVVQKRVEEDVTASPRGDSLWFM